MPPPPPALAIPAGLTMSSQVKISYFGQPVGRALGHSVLYLTGAGKYRV